MELFKKKDSKFYWYDFKVRDQRYRGSTKETNKTRAEKIAALKLSQVIEGSDPLDRKAPTLQQFSARFLNWVESAKLGEAVQKVLSRLPDSDLARATNNRNKALIGHRPQRLRPSPAWAERGWGYRAPAAWR